MEWKLKICLLSITHQVSIKTMICFFKKKQLTGIFAWSSYNFSWTTLGQMSTFQLSQVHFRTNKENGGAGS